MPAIDGHEPSRLAEVLAALSAVRSGAWPSARRGNARLPAGHAPRQRPWSTGRAVGRHLLCDVAPVRRLHRYLLTSRAVAGNDIEVGVWATWSTRASHVKRRIALDIEPKRRRGAPVSDRAHGDRGESRRTRGPGSRLRSWRPTRCALRLLEFAGSSAATRFRALGWAWPPTWYSRRLHPAADSRGYARLRSHHVRRVGGSIECD